jgi:glycosyltransferase involved in cell wall biosynthesis
VRAGDTTPIGRAGASGRRLRVLALTPFPADAANTRTRLLQFLPALAATGIDVTVRPFVDAATFRLLSGTGARGRTALGLARGAARRVGDLVRAGRADRVLVVREAMLAGPPVIELLATHIGRCPLVLDLDDPCWVPYESPSFGRLGTLARWPTKALGLIDRAGFVTCGSSHIAAFVRRRGRRAVTLPPAVDTDVYRPAGPRPGARRPVPVVGWIGSHSTWPYLEAVLPALAAAHRTRPFRLRVVGAGHAASPPPGLDVDSCDWSLAREPRDFAELDLGLYPLPAGDPWAAGKAGLKSVLYMASGVPFVASPVGGAAELGVGGTTHVHADDPESWRTAIVDLLGDPDRRAAMGAAGRAHALTHHTAAAAAAVLAGALHEAGR